MASPPWPEGVPRITLGTDTFVQVGCAFDLRLEAETDYLSDDHGLVIDRSHQRFKYGESEYYVASIRDVHRAQSIFVKKSIDKPTIVDMSRLSLNTPQATVAVNRMI